VDFLGVNHYSTSYAVRTTTNHGEAGWAADQEADFTRYKDGVLIGPKADSDWLYVVPWGIGKLLNYIQHRYNDPDILITENGCDVPNESSLPLSQALNDTFRVDYYRMYLGSVLGAIRTGVKVKGYLAWSLVDNFEWADGYARRFGLHFVDYQHGYVRYPKASALWFKQLLHRDVTL